MKKLSVILLVLLALASCESRSGQRDRTNARYGTTTTATATTNADIEKVVVLKLESAISTLDGGVENYKVRRISKGVVQFIRLYNQPAVFSPGDTIYFKF